MSTRSATAIAVIMAALPVVLVAAVAGGQVVPVDRDTQVRSVSFRVEGGPVLPGLDAQVATHGQGVRGRLPRVIQRLLFVRTTPSRPFNAHELQRDKERLRQRYTLAGYPRAAVDYDVRRDPRKNLVDVTFRIDPGSPLLVRTVAVTWDSAGPSPEADPDPLHELVTPLVRVQTGTPLDRSAIAATVTAITTWYGRRGYALASVTPDLAVDSATSRATVMFRTTAGPRSRVGTIRIEGNRAISTTVVRSLLPLRPGDWYSLSDLQAAVQRLTALDAVSRVTFDRWPTQPGDTTVNLALRLWERPQRRLDGQVGYTTDGGLTGEVSWTHANLFGAARSLTANLTGQSGALAVARNADKSVRASLAAVGPIPGRHDLTLSAGPYAEYRNDYRDRSLEAGISTTLLYRLGPLSSVALRHELASRRIYEYRFGDFSGGLDILTLLRLGAQGILDSLGTRIGTHTVALSATLGELDVPSDPSRGLVVEPSLTLSVPGSLTSAEYATALVRASGYRPVTRWLTVAARLGGGKLLPYGKSIPATSAEGTREYLRLRDVLFTAGGGADVRGWQTGLLGPKLPQFTIRAAPDSGAELTADRYSALGGFNLVYGTTELRAPLPPWQDRVSMHAFLDAGRVWSHDERFGTSDDDSGLSRLYWSTGAGLNYQTPIGAVRVEVGYKLNPSILDVADPGDVTRAILVGRPLESVPRSQSRRFRLHIGVGRRL